MEFDNNKPIYIQLVGIIKEEIMAGILKENDKLLSVREYAAIYKVNPNTMQKALQELEREKLIYTERTNGKFVTSDKKLIEDLKKKKASELALKFIKDMNNIGISNNELVEYLKKEGM